MSHRAYVGIGSNLGNRVANAERAVTALERLGAIARRSSWYRTQPWGNRDQPWFLNAVVALETELSPRALLDRLHAIEDALGRVRSERWGPRTIDLDLLLYDDATVDEPGLHLPHPQLRERAFVLVPLAEIDAGFGALRDALPESERAGVVRVQRENVTAMPDGGTPSTSERIRALARFLSESDAVRVCITRGDEVIELDAFSRGSQNRADGRSAAEPPAHRVDTIKADLVGVFHLSRPAPSAGDLFDSDRELGYIEALGIRTPIHSMGGGRLVAVASDDGAPVEYGQPLFLVARGR